jgi:hypothetical protein
MGQKGKREQNLAEFDNEGQIGWMTTRTYHRSPNLIIDDSADSLPISNGGVAGIA